MKAIENPIKRIFLKEADLLRVFIEIDMGDEKYRGWRCKKGIYRVEVDSFGEHDREKANKLVNDLMKKFGITTKIMKSKIKPVTFAEMVTEE